MNEHAHILEVGELDLRFEPSRWEFPDHQAAAIAAHWGRLIKSKPSLFNGRVLLLGQRLIEPGSDGLLKLSGVFFETDYADYVAWAAFGHPGERVDNCFSMAALRSDDGAFLLGEMAHHTYSAGQIYFPAGTPDPSDVFDGKVDLEASARRELLEETGLLASETNMAPDWTVVMTPQRIACMKLMTFPLPAERLKTRIEAFLARDPLAELARIHIVRDPYDIDETRVPIFVADYLRYAFAQRLVG
ncbi:MAG: NUDIX hydrolase [Hyphomicrobiales bacterium]|nr:NUDIX hydrolase [Hyphomicrobiales bacterium]